MPTQRPRSEERGLFHKERRGKSAFDSPQDCQDGSDNTLAYPGRQGMPTQRTRSEERGLFHNVDEGRLPRKIGIKWKLMAGRKTVGFTVQLALKIQIPPF